MHALRLLDTPPEDRFERITRVARQLLGVPIAMVTLVDMDRTWVKSSAGFPVREIGRNASFCSYAVTSGQLLEVADATTDARFARFPVVIDEPNVRFYAGQPVAAPSGYLVGTLAVMDRVPRRLTDQQREALRDLAAWVELEYAIRQVNQWEQQTERARREFVSVVSHELRTPLTSIRGSLELIESGRFGELPERVRKLVRIAADNTDRLVRIAEDVVDVHQMQRGQLHLSVGDVVASEVVEQAVQTVQDVALRAGVTIEVSGTGRARLRADGDRLVQVLTNLLANAVRVAPKGESVRIACRTLGSWVMFTVRDRGPGVPQGQLDEIFEPFAQLGRPERGRRGGAGLGLTIARGIVEAHGGQLRARPAAGGGSVFEVSLPAAGPDVDRPWW